MLGVGRGVGRKDASKPCSWAAIDGKVDGRISMVVGGFGYLDILPEEGLAEGGLPFEGFRGWSVGRPWGLGLGLVHVGVGAGPQG